MDKEKKLQVFISSTYKDLINERQAAVEAVLNAGHIPAGMELFKAGDQTQKEIIKEWIEESDVYLLILGARYGSIDSELEISYTEWEYNLAKELGVPRFSLVLTDEYINQKVVNGELKTDDVERNIGAFKKFKSEVESQMVEFIDHKQAIKGAVLGSLNNITRRNSNLKGWIRYSSKFDEEKFYELVNENQNLKKQLQENKVTLKKQTKDLKQGNDIVEIKINFNIYDKITKINKNGNEYTRYESSVSDFIKIETSFNEIASVLLPVLVQYGEQGILKREVEEIIEELILSKTGFTFAKESYGYRNYKVYFNEKENYKTDFKIPDLDRIITQLKLLNFVDFSQTIDENTYRDRINVYVRITEIGLEELQSLFAFKTN